ncbi:MAG: hypothetical protein IIT39_08185, partial [Clostridia bacterium]|nr:hypothetical protein [Clostridia bacterium]
SDQTPDDQLDTSGQNFSYSSGNQNYYGRWYNVPEGYDHVLFYRFENNSVVWQTQDVTLSAPFYGRGTFYDALSTETNGKKDVQVSSILHISSCLNTSTKEEMPGVTRHSLSRLSKHRIIFLNTMIQMMFG